MKLRLCYEGELKNPGLSLKLIATVYNLCYWISRDYSYVFLPTEQLAVAKIYYNGKYSLYSVDCVDVDDLVKTLRFSIGVEENLSEFFEIASRDPLLGLFADEYRGFRIRSTSLWMGLLTGICQQNASFLQGWRMLHEIVSVYERVVSLENEETIPRPPTPREVLGDVDRLVATGVGYRAKTIVNVARALENKEIPGDLLRLSPDEMEYVLTSIKGIGPYTARLAIAITARRYELPPIDRWLRKIASLVYAVDENYVEKYWLEKWGKWAALASIATTIALDAEPLQKAIERVRKRELLPKLNKSPTPVNMIGFCR
ncbi:MAG: hypothetical protein QXT64_07960 [Desulfurococcaceae archaeon]